MQENETKRTFTSIFTSFFTSLFTSLTAQPWIINFINPILIKISAFSIFKIAIELYSKDKQDFYSEDKEKRQKLISKRLRQLSVILFSSIWIGLISYCLLKSKIFTNPSQVLKIMNFNEVIHVIWDVSLMALSISGIFSSFFLPSNIITILVFLAMAGIIAYLIFQLPGIETKPKLGIALGAFLAIITGWLFSKGTIESYIKRMQNAVNSLISKNRTVIPAVLSAAFVVVMQTFVISFALGQGITSVFFIIPVVCLSDWSYNIVNNSLTVFFSTFFYKSKLSSDKQDWRFSFNFVKNNFGEICYKSLYESISSVLHSSSTIMKFIDNEEGLVTSKLRNIESILDLFFEVEKLAIFGIFGNMGIKAAIDYENDKLIKKKAESNAASTSEFIKHVSPVLNKFETTNENLKSIFESNESITLILLQFRSLAFRIPMLLTTFSLFKFSGLTNVLLSKYSLGFVQKPLKFLEAVTKNMSMASIVGLTMYLAITFYVLSIWTVYFVDKYHEDMNKAIVPEKPPQDVLGKVAEASNQAISGAKSAISYFKGFFTNSNPENADIVDKGIIGEDLGDKTD